MLALKRTRGNTSKFKVVTWSPGNTDSIGGSRLVVGGFTIDWLVNVPKTRIRCGLWCSARAALVESLVDPAWILFPQQLWDRPGSKAPASYFFLFATSGRRGAFVRRVDCTRSAFILLLARVRIAMFSSCNNHKIWSCWRRSRPTRVRRKNAASRACGIRRPTATGGVSIRRPFAKCTECGTNAVFGPDTPSSADFMPPWTPHFGQRRGRPGSCATACGCLAKLGGGGRRSRVPLFGRLNRGPHYKRPTSSQGSDRLTTDRCSAMSSV